MQKEFIVKNLQKILDKAIDQKNIFGVTICIKLRDETWHGQSGDFQPSEPFFIASVTKLFITALILKLVDQDKINLKDKIGKYLQKEIIAGLHIYKGKEYSDQISVENLMAHTSGIPDYFQQKNVSGQILQNELTSGRDKAWDFNKVIEWSKSMDPLFIPSQSKKAHYSDTNYQLLGKITEHIYGDQLQHILKREIFDPLWLKQTYLYTDLTDGHPKLIYFKDIKLNIPKAMCSFRADGGIVSNAPELMKFLEAFFTGKLFSLKHIREIQVWNKIFFPLESGIGIQRFKVPWYFSPFKKIPELIGHSGLSGAFAFFCPERQIYLTGTVNQIVKPGSSFRIMIKVLEALL